MNESDTPGEEPLDDWPFDSTDDCDRCAREVQAIVGGVVKTIRPGDNWRVLGASPMNPDGDWQYHVVVLSGDRVYDAFTGRHGMSISDYKEQFLYEDDIDFGF